MALKTVLSGITVLAVVWMNTYAIICYALDGFFFPADGSEEILRIRRIFSRNLFTLGLKIIRIDSGQ